MFILTNGKEYVMENPIKQGQYVSSTSPNHAKEFTYKQARNLLQNKRKVLGWIKSGNFYMVNNENGKPEIDVPKFSNEGIFVGEKDFEFDDSVVDTIKNEVDSIIGLGRNYLIVLLNAIKEQWTIGRIKAELSKAKYVPYKGRTKYFDIANELLGEY